MYATTYTKIVHIHVSNSKSLRKNPRPWRRRDDACTRFSASQPTPPQMKYGRRTRSWLSSAIRISWFTPASAKPTPPLSSKSSLTPTKSSPIPRNALGTIPTDLKSSSLTPPLPTAPSPISSPSSPIPCILGTTIRARDSIRFIRRFLTKSTLLKSISRKN